MKWLKIIKEAAILFVIAVLSGVVVNALSPAGIPIAVRFDVSAPDDDDLFLIIDASEARCLIEAGAAVFVDARPASQFEAGHIPGARSLPVYQTDDYLLSFLSAVRPDIPVIIYCSSITCEDSRILAEELSAMGYSDIRIFAGGMAAWLEKGYAVAAE